MPVSTLTRKLRRKSRRSQAKPARRRTNHIARSTSLQELEDRTLLTVTVMGNVFQDFDGNDLRDIFGDEFLNGVEGIEVRVVKDSDGSTVTVDDPNDASATLVDFVTTDEFGNYELIIPDLAVADNSTLDVKLQFDLGGLEPVEAGATTALAFDFVDVFFGILNDEYVDSDVSTTPVSGTLFETEVFTLKDFDSGSPGVAEDEIDIGLSAVADGIFSLSTAGGVSGILAGRAAVGNPTEAFNDVLILDVGVKPQTGTISGFVWDDVDGDGKFDDTENGVKDVDVTVFNSDGDKIGETTTDVTGQYTVEDVPAGEDHEVHFDAGDREFTQQGVLAASPIFNFLDSEADTNGVATVETLLPEQEVQFINAGLLGDGSNILSAEGLTLANQFGLVTHAQEEQGVIVLRRTVGGSHDPTGRGTPNSFLILFANGDLFLWNGGSNLLDATQNVGNLGPNAFAGLTGLPINSVLSNL